MIYFTRFNILHLLVIKEHRNKIFLESTKKNFLKSKTRLSSIIFYQISLIWIFFFKSFLTLDIVGKTSEVLIPIKENSPKANIPE